MKEIDKQLLEAVQKYNLEEVKKYLLQGADPRAQDEEGNSALHLAVLNQDDEKDFGALRCIIETSSKVID